MTSRMYLVQHMEPTRTLARCTRCKFEASSQYIDGDGLCGSCRDAATDPSINNESVTVQTVLVRASRRFGHVPEYVKRLVAGRKREDWISESELPPTLQWRPSKPRKRTRRLER